MKSLLLSRLQVLTCFYPAGHSTVFLDPGVAVTITIFHSFSLVFATNMTTTATRLCSYGIDQTKQDNRHCCNCTWYDCVAAGFNLTIERMCSRQAATGCFTCPAASREELVALDGISRSVYERGHPADPNCWTAQNHADGFLLVFASFCWAEAILEK